MNGTQENYKYDQSQQINDGLFSLKVFGDQIEYIDIYNDHIEAQIDQMPNHNKPQRILPSVDQYEEKIEK